MPLEDRAKNASRINHCCSRHSCFLAMISFFFLVFASCRRDNGSSMYLFRDYGKNKTGTPLGNPGMGLGCPLSTTDYHGSFTSLCVCCLPLSVEGALFSFHCCFYTQVYPGCLSVSAPILVPSVYAFCDTRLLGSIVPQVMCQNNLWWDTLNPPMNRKPGVVPRISPDYHRLA